MKLGVWTRLMLAALPLLAGCKGFWQAPSGSGGSSNTPTTLSSGNFYVLDKGTSVSQIFGFNIVSGTLTALSGSPYAVNGVAYAIAMDPTGSFLYVSSTAGVFLYTINATTGALTMGAEVSTDTIATAIAVDTTDRWLIEALAAGSLAAIPITPSGAYDTNPARAEQTMALASTQVQQMAMAPNGLSLAVALGSSGTQIFPFTPAVSMDPIEAALAPTIAVVNTAGTGAAVAVAYDPQNRFLYIGETAVFTTSGSSGGLRAFSFTASPFSATELTGSPWASGGTGPHAIAPTSTGSYVYVASWQGSSAGLITPFQLTTSGSSYVLTALSSTVATGVEPMGMTEDNLGHFMLTVNSGANPSLNAYIFDTTTVGMLDQTNTDATAVSPEAVVATP